MKNNTGILQTALKAAVRGGNVLEEHAHDAQRRFQKKESFRDVVTSIDTYAQEEVIEILKNHKYTYNVIAEEQDHVGDMSMRGTYWLVDPLDGTVNYIHHIPFYAVSVAFVEKGKPVVGVVFNPVTKELFYGAKGFGVYKNEQKIKAVQRTKEQTLFAVSFSGKKYASAAERKKEFSQFQRINDASMGCLRTGSAAMNLACCAQGSFGGCWGKASKWWDVGAGLLLCQLAGAKTTYTFSKTHPWLVDYHIGTDVL